MKYHNKKVTVDDIVFDSKREARRFTELQRLEHQGEISRLRRQVKFVLIPPQRDETGRVVERECAYYADFVYLMGGKTVVEDTKGVKTRDYIIKRKLMLERYGIKVKEV